MTPAVKIRKKIIVKLKKITFSIDGWLIIIINIKIVHEVHKKKEKRNVKTHKSIKSVYTQMLSQSKHIVMREVVHRHAR